MNNNTLEQAIALAKRVRNGQGSVIVEYLNQSGFYIVAKSDLHMIKGAYRIAYDFFKEPRGKSVGRPTLSAEAHATRVEAVSGHKSGDPSKSRSREDTLMKRLNEAESDEETQEIFDNWIKKNKEIDSRKRPAVLPESIKQPAGDMAFSLIRNDASVGRGRAYVNTQKARPKGSMSSKQTRNYLTPALSASAMVGMPISGKSRTVLKREAEENKEQRCRSIVERNITDKIIAQRTNRSKDSSKAERNRRRKEAKKARG